MAKQDNQFCVEVYSCGRWVAVAWFPTEKEAAICAAQRVGKVRKMARKTL
ncbi:hypothetical protein LCGC14_0814780 [marine sediment metagenome]|uniref:DUF2188 domain-containing protein n=1 Tax=marine sediment metagenome TaxID=412755 RepID=A0A0F9PQ64_9ZZZZ